MILYLSMLINAIYAGYRGLVQAGTKIAEDCQSYWKFPAQWLLRCSLP